MDALVDCSRRPNPVVEAERVGGVVGGDFVEDGLTRNLSTEWICDPLIPSDSSSWRASTAGKMQADSSAMEMNCSDAGRGNSEAASGAGVKGRASEPE